MVKGAWKAKIAGLLSRAKRSPELSSSVVKRDKFDDGVLDDMLERAKLFRDTRFTQPEVDLDNLYDEDGNPIVLTDKQRERAEQYVAWEDLYDDVFRTLHTYHEPELLPADQVKPSRELNRRIIQQMTANDAFQRLRPDTRHSAIEAAFTTIAMADNLSTTLNTELQEFVVRAKEMSELEEQLPPGGGGEGTGGTGTGPGVPGGGGKGQQPPIFDPKNPPPGQGDPSQQPPGPDQGNGGGGGGDPTNQQGQPHGQGPDHGNLDEIAQQIADKAAQQQQQGLGTGVMKAIENALNEGQEAADAIANLPGYGEGSENRMNPDQMIELAKRYRESPVLRNVSRMVGRMQRDMRQKRAKRVVGGNEEIVDVTVGNDLTKLLPHELGKLTHPLMKLDFQRRYHERELLEYETEGTESAGRGPVVICIDGSGSMGGMRNEWARSVALALITIARKEKRDAAAIEFSSAGSIRKWDFLKKQQVDPDHVLDFVTHFFGGGTQIVEGMTVAQQFINERPEFRKADIVLITDGGDYWNEGRDDVMRDELQAKGVRIHGVSIGFDGQSNDYLKRMCDSVVSAYDLAGSNEATTHLAQAIT
jgi:uncharacterized protein with von Willebrand factor type A (vWA) domain